MFDKSGNVSHLFGQIFLSSKLLFGGKKIFKKIANSTLILKIHNLSVAYLKFTNSRNLKTGVIVLMKSSSCDQGLKNIVKKY